MDFTSVKLQNCTKTIREKNYGFKTYPISISGCSNELQVS